MFVNIKLKKGAQMPRKAHNSDAAFDLYAHWIEYQEGMMFIGTGVHIEVPNGHVGLVFPRSSITNTIHRMANCVGVIDPGYTGEILAKYDSTWNTDAKRYEIGDRCAQILFLKTLDVQFAEVEELAETNRGDAGYGSTNEPVHFTVKMDDEWRCSEEFKQRIKDGMQKAKDNGKHIGRPIGSKEDADQFIAKHIGVARKIQSGNHSIREIANSEGVSPNTVMKVKNTLAELKLLERLDIEDPFLDS